MSTFVYAFSTGRPLLAVNTCLRAPGGVLPGAPDTQQTRPHVIPSHFLVLIHTPLPVSPTPPCEFLPDMNCRLDHILLPHGLLAHPPKPYEPSGSDFH